MSRKPYARTFRYSEDTRKILDQYDGDFDSLVHYAFFTAREKEKEIEILEKKKTDLECSITMLYVQRSEFVDIIGDMSNLRKSFNFLQDDFKNLRNKVNSFVET